MCRPQEPQKTRTKESKAADGPLADQVIIRKESKSYRMSAIQNLQTFGEWFLIEESSGGGWGKGES